MNTIVRLTVGLLLLPASNLPAATHYVSRQNYGNASPPYTNWATAATDIQDAVAASAPGDVVMVADGVYPSVNVTNPLALVSVNGPQTTIIKGNLRFPGYGYDICVRLTDGASLSGFTLTNGSAVYGGGVECGSKNAFVTNCLIVGNSSGKYGGGGGASGGTLFNCTLSGNFASNGGAGGGATDCTLYNCTLSDNSARVGGGAYGCALYNCTLTGNSDVTPLWGGPEPGGGACNCTLYNCTLTGNLPDGANSSTLYNSIVYFNGSHGANYDASSTLNYCCTTPLPISGVGNISSDPQFVNYANANLHLQFTSPCINSGNNAYATVATDLDGNLRISGETVDMGAYEFQFSGPPVIFSEPSDQTVYAGGAVTFAVTSAGSWPLSWQWQFNGTAIVNATNSNLALTAIRTNQAGGYSVVITNSQGALTSQVALLTVIDAAPSFQVQPLGQTVIAGTNVIFNAAAVGSLPLSWQWSFDGTAMLNATNPTLTLASVTTNQSGNYFVVVTNSLGSATSQVAVLTVLPRGAPPSITTQPVGQTIFAGGTATFTVQADSLLPLSWQWLFNGTAIPNATGSSLTLVAATPDQAGIYSVIVSNALGSATSAGARLIVRVAGTKYVSQMSTNPVPPYSTWETAARTIQDAVNTALAGDQIVVSNGVYIGSLAVTNALALVSVNGSQSTIIDAGSYPNPPPFPNYCVFLTDGASLSGFTLTNGFGFDTGGGLWCRSTNAFVTNCLIVGNKFADAGSGRGGAGVSGGTLFNCTLTGNSANTGGGAADSALYNCTLTGNSASSGHGAGAYHCTLYHCTLTANSGGGAYTSTLYGCTLNGSHSGGGADDCTLYNCTLTDNSTGAHDCTLYNCKLTGNSPASGAQSSTLYNCTLSGNSAYAGGGACSSTLFNCTLTGNSAIVDYGAGILGQGGGAYGCTLYNCTLTGNSAYTGGGAYSSTLYNSIVYFNWSGANYDPSSILNFCCTTPLPPKGVGNIGNDPQLVDYPNGNLHLQSNSPCINAGNNALVSGTNDLDGNPRIVGGTVDIGAYEYQGIGSRISYAWLQQYSLPTDGSADFIDSDRDGMNNWQEWVCGTCPTNAQSALRMVSATPAGTNITVIWQSVSGVNYFLECSTNLTASPCFKCVMTNIVGQVGTTSYIDTNAAGAGSLFYRVGVRTP